VRSLALTLENRAMPEYTRLLCEFGKCERRAYGERVSYALFYFGAAQTILGTLINYSVGHSQIT
jgi:hypothetical protein